MTDLRLIQYFEVVYRLLSFSKAAEELHLTHSAVTRSIKTLEEAWGTQLFYRTTRSVTPTEAGERLYPMAVELLAFAKVVQRETVAGDRHLKVIGGPIAYDILLPTAIVEFRKTSPDVRMLADVMPPHSAIEELVQRRANMVLFNMSTLEALPHAGRLHFQEIMAEDFIMLHRPGHPVSTKDLGPDTFLESLLAYPWAFPGYLNYLDGQLPEGMEEAVTQAGAYRGRLQEGGRARAQYQGLPRQPLCRGAQAAAWQCQTAEGARIGRVGATHLCSPRTYNRILLNCSHQLPVVSHPLS